MIVYSIVNLSIFVCYVIYDIFHILCNDGFGLSGDTVVAVIVKYVHLLSQKQLLVNV